MIVQGVKFSIVARPNNSAMAISRDEMLDLVGQTTVLLAGMKNHHQSKLEPVTTIMRSTCKG